MTDANLPGEEELNSLFLTAPEKRVEYFMKRVALTKEVWLILSDDQVLEIQNSEGKWIIPVWPYDGYAKRFETEVCKEINNTSILRYPLQKFIDLSKRMIADEYSTIGVFPSTDQTVRELSIEQFERWIASELDRVERYPDPKFF